MRLKQVSEGIILDRLRKYITTHGTDIWIKDDLSLFTESNLGPIRKVIWTIAKNFKLIKSKIYHIDPEQTADSLKLIEREIAKDISTQEELIPVFQAAIRKFNVTNYEKPYLALTLPIHSAILNNHFKHVIRLIEKDKSFLFQVNSEGETPLHVAFRRQADPGIIDFLLMNHPFPSEIDKVNASTPLHLAVFNDDIGSVRQLLKKNVPADIKNNDNLTPYDLACLKKNKAICKLLLDYRARSSNSYPR